MVNLRAMIEKYGFYINHVPGGDPQSPTGVNINTNGLPESFKHPDIQIVMGLPGPLAGTLMHTIVDWIKEGNKIEVGKSYDFVLDGMNVEFAWTVECNRDVLRMIMPDKSGNVSKKIIAEPYKKQWEGTSSEPKGLGY